MRQATMKGMLRDVKTDFCKVALKDVLKAAKKAVLRVAKKAPTSVTAKLCRICWR